MVERRSPYAATASALTKIEAIDVVPDLCTVRGDSLDDGYGDEDRVSLQCDDRLAYPSIKINLAHSCTTNQPS